MRFKKRAPTDNRQVVAMGNAIDEVKAVAEYVCDTTIMMKQQSCSKKYYSPGYAEKVYRVFFRILYIYKIYGKLGYACKHVAACRPCRIRNRNTSGRYLVIIEFTHFASFYAFNTNDDDFKNKEVIRGVKVRVCIDME